MDDLDKKVFEYVRVFNENVPVFQLPSLTTNELIELIDRSLESGKPIKTERTRRGVNY